MASIIAKLFGSKKDRDIKELRPVATKVAAEFSKLSNISDDQLRGKSDEFRQRIKDYIKDIESQISSLREKADKEHDIYAKDAIFSEIDKLKKDRNQKTEEILEKLAPEAFAVVKETARRLTQNGSLKVTATDWDRDMSQRKSNVVIDGNTAIWKNEWDAAGKAIQWDMVHYDVQLMGGMVLHQGKIAEMATGEGKTLVSTLPAYINALTGFGVHVVTVNDYLAKRDMSWNAPLFEFHKMTVDCIDLHEPNTDERRRAYRADITYGTNNEFGFDYLRDNMTTHPEYLVQRDHHFAIVDEIDSVLIDEARTPLIISGPVPRGDQHEYHEMKPRIERLVREQRKLVVESLAKAKRMLVDANGSVTGDKKALEEGGLALFRSSRGLPKNTALIKFLSETGITSVKQKTEAYYMQDKGKNMHIVDDELFFTIDEKNNSVELTEKGINLITQGGEDPHLFILPDVGARLAEIQHNKTMSEDEKIAAKDILSQEFGEKSERLHTIHQLLKAYTLFEKDVEYIVSDGKVQIVDEQTGRVLPGRRYSDGLHQAIEAKENVKVEAATQTFATVTLQNYFRMYHKLSGMTGTAETEASEFFEIYKLDVVVVPTNRPIIRKDAEDMVFKTAREKFNAVIQEIERLRQAGRPVLVGTTNVEVSELLSRMLSMNKIPHEVLNAKQHAREAEIVALAGLAGNVTIATNMAGRGTDIKLGPGVKEAGGLAIIGTERHESRRIDRQLRGRSGRQGDPGSSVFFVSLEDQLMRLFGSERIARIMDRLGIKEGEVIQHKMITNSITKAQKKVEENNFAMRKRLLEYDDVMNSQREVVYARRRNALFGDRIQVDIDNMLEDLVTAIVRRNYQMLDADSLQMDCMRALSIAPKIQDGDLGNYREEEVIDLIYDEARAYYIRKRKQLAATTLEGLKNIQATHPQVQLVEINFLEGNRRVRVVVDINKAIASDGEEVPQALEKGIMLGVIDEKWKNHLREMDELRNAVQNAVYEQKDPLLVYKFESYQIFESMLSEINEQVISLIFKAKLDVPDEGQVQRAQNVEVERDDFSRMKAKHDDAETERKREAANQFTNSNAPESDRPLTRRERREADRGGKRK